MSETNKTATEPQVVQLFNCAGCGHEFPEALLVGTPPRCADCAKLYQQTQVDQAKKAQELHDAPPDRYRIVCGQVSADIEMKVNQLLAAGWRLHGGLQLTSNDVVFQAMTRESETINNGGSLE